MMNIKELRLEQIVPYSNNPRVNDRAVDIVIKSIQEFGFQVPLVLDKDMVIIAGHTRFRAAKRMGLETVPCVVADKLNPEQVQAFRIMDNKSSEFAEWDYIKLLEEIQDLKSEDYDTQLTGFSDVELQDILDEIGVEQEKKEKEKPELEFTTEIMEEHQYIVLYFDNTLDWQVAKEVFKLQNVLTRWSKKDKPNLQRAGLGRVVHGKQYIDLLKRHEEELQ